MTARLFFGLSEEVGLVAHLVGPAAAAGLGVAGDAEGHAAFLEDPRRGLGQVLHVLVVAGEAAHVVENVHLLLGGVGESQTLGPVAPLAPLGGDHAARRAQPADHLVQGGVGMTVIHRLDPQLLDGPEDFHVHRVFAGHIATAAEVAVVDAVHVARRVLEPILEAGSAHVHPAAARVEMEVVLRDAGAHVGVLEPLHLLHRDELARIAPAAHVHIAGIFF